MMARLELFVLAFALGGLDAIDDCGAFRGCIKRRSDAMIVKSVEQALVHYQTDHVESCPASLDELVWDGYLTRYPLDEKERPLRFVCPGRHNPDGADISAAGRDGRFGTADDVTSWE